MSTTAYRHEFPNARTYATRENAIKAVERKYGPSTDCLAAADLQYVICVNDEGRYYPLFIGWKAAQYGTHFHFPVTA